ncbi:Flp family type IVb pilin [Sphingomonas oligophenolica]|uniref:Flp family type IVb pilin n=1 Tax=Sphingomonas oligophenolica TaxID=301154 RepID=A0A502CQX8_9SPHN|nr:Flp family type IVb pilin [Sphingomonas oligophenolica]TPG14529.1 Flp family type IVb pilin [Sphingomonas oligophenolica]
MWTPFARRPLVVMFRLLRDQRGATAVEYGLIVACIVIIMVVSLHGLADVTTEMWNGVSTKVANAN